MDTFFVIVATVFGGIVLLAGTGLLIFGIKTSFGERKNCTLSATGIVRRKLYDYTGSINDTTGSHGGLQIPCKFV
jgi:hypothetical protein